MSVLAPAFLGAFGDRLHGWSANAFGRPGTKEIGEPALRAARRSETIYIFGSGYSLNALTEADWRAIERHDTLGFSYFALQKYVRADFHLIRELGVTAHDNDKRKDIWRDVYADYARVLRENPRYRDTIYVVQAGWTAYAGNRFVGLGYLPEAARLFRYRNGLRGAHPPAESFAQGLTHGPATVTDCVNFASVVGWRRIVLCGIDLYDRRYFWHSKNRAHFELPCLTDRGGGEYAGEGEIGALHRTSAPMRDWAERWRAYYVARGISLEVLNPKSLLAEILPIHKLRD